MIVGIILELDAGGGRGIAGRIDGSGERGARISSHPITHTPHFLLDQRDIRSFKE